MQQKNWSFNCCFVKNSGVDHSHLLYVGYMGNFSQIHEEHKYIANFLIEFQCT